MFGRCADVVAQQPAEVASGARKRGLPGTIVEARGTPLVRAIGEEMGSALSALTLDRRADVMKYRGLIARRASWADALDFAEKRNAKAAVKQG